MTISPQSESVFRSRYAGAIGNLLEHYEKALFGILAPFLAPLFFANKDPLIALILTYAILPLGGLTRPLGALFFGLIGDRLGRRVALFYSLLGMAIVSIGIGSLPIYEKIGLGAPLLLALGKMLQSFFAAGETTGGALFVLENTAPPKRGFMSSWYGVSSIGGSLLASSLVTLLSAKGYIEQGWRYLFWAGGITAFWGVFLRLKTKEGSEFIEAPKVKNLSMLHIIRENRVAFFAIVIASSFSHATYSLPFTLMNGFIPLITDLSKTEVMKVNTLLLVVDLFLLPCFGFLANRFGKERVMLSGALGSALCAIPLFLLLDHGSLAVVIGVRLTIIVFGVAFAAPYYAWAMEQVPTLHRYLILSLAGAFGAMMPTSALSLWLYKISGWTGAPAIYLTVIGGAAAWVVYSFSLEKKAHFNLRAQN